MVLFLHKHKHIGKFSNLHQSTFNESLIALRNYINSKEIPENENPKNVIDIAEKLLDFHKQQKGKRRPRTLALHPLDLATCIKILTPKQILQGLPIALAQVKVGKTSENLLNEIRQIIYFLYRAKEITKKYIII